jgi:hypothetical protein
MTDQQLHEDLRAHAHRLVAQGFVESRWVSINDRAGTVRNRQTDELLHYESGMTVVWAPWRPQYWSNA